MLRDNPLRWLAPRLPAPDVTSLAGSSSFCFRRSGWASGIRTRRRHPPGHKHPCPHYLAHLLPSSSFVFVPARLLASSSFVFVPEHIVGGTQQLGAKALKQFVQLVLLGLRIRVWHSSSTPDSNPAGIHTIGPSRIPRHRTTPCGGGHREVPRGYRGRRAPAPAARFPAWSSATALP